MIKELMVIFRKEFSEPHEWCIQIMTNDPKEAKKQVEELKTCGNIIEVKLIKTKEVNY